MPQGDRLPQVRDRLVRWRAKHGGRGIRIPEAMWAEVVEVAQLEGVEATARALHMDPARLAARMTAAETAAGGMAAGASAGFVELDAGRLGLSRGTVIVSLRRRCVKKRSGLGTFGKGRDHCRRGCRARRPAWGARAHTLAAAEPRPSPSTRHPVAR